MAGEWSIEGEARRIVEAMALQKPAPSLTDLVAAGIRAGVDKAAAIELDNHRMRAAVVALAEKLAVAVTDAVLIARNANPPPPAGQRERG